MLSGVLTRLSMAKTLYNTTINLKLLLQFNTLCDYLITYNKQ